MFSRVYTSVFLCCKCKCFTSVFLVCSVLFCFRVCLSPAVLQAWLLLRPQEDLPYPGARERRRAIQLARGGRLLRVRKTVAAGELALLLYWVARCPTLQCSYFTDSTCQLCVPTSFNTPFFFVGFDGLALLLALNRTALDVHLIMFRTMSPLAKLAVSLVHMHVL